MILKRDGSVTTEQLNAHNANVIRVIKKLKAAGNYKEANSLIATYAVFVTKPFLSLLK